MRKKTVLPSLALALGLALPIAAQGDSNSLSTHALEMLEAGLSEEIVLEWLEGVEEPSSRPTPEELIALKKAGATDRLLKALLALARGERVEPAPTPGPAASAPAETDTDAAAEQSEAAPAPVAAALTPPPSSEDQGRATTFEGVLVSFKLSYEPPKVDYEDELWDFYVYLDGEPLAYVPPILSVLDRSEILGFRQRLAPGRHVIRVAQERHERRRKNRWQHSARVSNQEFEFEVEGRAEGELELVFSEGFLGTRSTGPLSFRYLQEDRVTELEGVGGDPESWPLLCEELEANTDAGGPTARAVQRELDDCVGWASLWSGISAPSRDSVRRAMAAFDFRPVPRGS